MKKNTMMRIASVLLIAVLMTTCVISGTFAKYITSDSGTDAVRVAKWGFEATENSIVLDQLFKTAYVNNEVNGAADIVAPGTENEITFSFAYDTTSNTIAAPEVAYTFAIDCTITGTNTNLDDSANFWWTLDGVKCEDNAALIAAVKALAGEADGSADYAPNTLPEAFYGNPIDGAAEHTIGWVWDFEGTDGDASDTALGNADVLENIVVTITITATQLDSYTAA